jgi:hypothetical protein
MSILRSVVEVGVIVVITAVLGHDAHADATPHDESDASALDLRACQTCLPRRVALDLYEAQSMSVWGPVALELALPGFGSLYAGDTKGAVITWAGDALAIGLALYGAPALFGGSATDARTAALIGGPVLGLATRIYGVCNTVQAVHRHNEHLQTILGLTPTVSFATPPTDDARAPIAILAGLTGHF